MKKPEFIKIGKSRFRISTIKRYESNGDKVKLWFNVSRFKIEYLEIQMEDESAAQFEVDCLDMILL